MNAYELASKLNRFNQDYIESKEINDAVNMLRQQADRIAELEECINACYAVQKMQAEEVYKGNDRIAELEKQVVIWEKATMDARIKSSVEKQNEPVAWMYACNGVWTAFSDELPPDDAYDEGTLIPLYTTPHHASDVKQTESKIIKEMNETYADIKQSLTTKPMTAELKVLLESVSGQYFLGQDKEEALVKKIREQYSTPQTKPESENQTISLSDEEIFELYKDCKSNHYIDFARAIEAKVRGEK